MTDKVLIMQKLMNKQGTLRAITDVGTRSSQSVLYCHLHVLLYLQKQPSYFAPVVFKVQYVKNNVSDKNYELPYF